MFNIGGDDKEKLEENMEEIKQLVNDDKGESEGQEEVSDQNSFGKQEEIDDLESFDSPEPNQAPQQNDKNENDFEGMQNELEDLQSQVQGNAQQEGTQKSEQEVEKPPQENTSEESVSTTQTREAPINSGKQRDEVKKLKDEIEGHIDSIEEGRSNRSIKKDVEEINQEREEEKREEEALFLNVESFEDIKEMVEEMHYLTTEMDDIMEHLVVGLEEDQETVDEAEQVISEFKTRRNSIEQTLKEN